MVIPVVLLLLVSFFNPNRADLYGNPSPPPPSVVAGKEFPPQSMQCNDPSTKCYAKNITCPTQCPTFKPSDPKSKACFIDCDSPKCEATCKNRTANCEGVGSACGDPRFVGADGMVFYFHGKTSHYFSLVSDDNLQINARFIGRRPEGRKRDNTWIQALGLMFDRHTFTLSADKVANWDHQKDHLRFTYDHDLVTLPEGHLAVWEAPDSRLTVERTAEYNSVSVVVAGVVEISATVVPVSKEDDRIHKYQIPEDDCFAHLEVQFKFFGLSERVEGVLGQTYRPEFKNPVKRGVAMPVMGGEHKYMTSSLESGDCKACIFKGNSKPSSMEPTIDDTVIDCSSKNSNGQGVVCRRR